MIGPITLAFMRMVIASVLLCLMRLFSKNRQKPDRKNLFLIFLSALIGVTLYYMIENYGILLTSASTASLISGSYPAIALLIGAFFFHEKLTASKAVGILISLLGIAVLSSSADRGSSSFTGIILLITDGVFWALYNYIVQAVDDSYSSLTVTSYQTWMAAVMMIPFLFLEKDVPLVLTPVSFACVIYLGVVCSCLAYVLYNAGLRGVSAFAAAAMLNLMPLSGTVLAALILHETIGMEAILGGALIIGGVVISTRRKR